MVKPRITELRPAFRKGKGRTLPRSPAVTCASLIFTPVGRTPVWFRVLVPQGLQQLLYRVRLGPCKFSLAPVFVDDDIEEVLVFLLGEQVQAQKPARGMLRSADDVMEPRLPRSAGVRQYA